MASKSFVKHDYTYVALSSNDNIRSIAGACGWKLLSSDGDSDTFSCCGLENHHHDEYFLGNESILLFIKKYILICDNVLRMFSAGVLPEHENWLKQFCLHVECNVLSERTMHSIFLRLDKLTENREVFETKLGLMSSQLKTAFFDSNRQEFASCRILQNFVALDSPLSFEQLRTMFLDALSSLSEDTFRPSSALCECASEELKNQVSQYRNLVCTIEGDLKSVFCCFDHEDYTFLPVRDLPKSKTGKIGVNSLSVFLQNPSSEFAEAVKLKEREISDLVFRLVKMRVHEELQQFVIKNSELILLRLCNTLSVSQNFHLDVLHQFPNSQYGCFMALNNAQNCHVNVQIVDDECIFEFPNMPLGHLKFFHSAAYIHSGVPPLCEGNSSIAMTWYQDLVLRNSTASLPHLSTNINYFGIAFNNLCISRIPSIQSCGGCKLELVALCAHLDETSLCKTKICSVCGEFRCTYCQNFGLKKHTSEQGVEDVVSLLTKVQHDNFNYEPKMKRVCAHEAGDLRQLKDIEFLKILISDKQLRLYSLNAEELFKKINYFDNTLKCMTFQELQKKIGVKCVRSFALSLCLYCIYVTDNSVGWKDLFVDCAFNESDVTARLTTLKSNVLDELYIEKNAKRLMKMLHTICVLEGLLLCCTGTKSAESSSCACGVKGSFKADKAYVRAIDMAKKTVDDSVVMVCLEKQSTYFIFLAAKLKETKAQGQRQGNDQVYFKNF